MGGFTFNGIHSNTMNIKGIRAPRAILPERKTQIVEIPFKSLPYVIPDESFVAEEVAVECFTDITNKSLFQIGREWVAWLHTPTWADLIFDEDPTFTYKAICTTAITVDDLRNPIVRINFTCAREDVTP